MRRARASVFRAVVMLCAASVITQGAILPEYGPRTLTERADLVVHGRLLGDDGGVARRGWDFFGSGDEYCVVWAFLELLPGGQGDWWPKLSYGAPDGDALAPSAP